MSLLVIGASAAGLSAATHARRLDPSLPITVLERGNAPSLGLCGLPYFVEGRVPQWASLLAKPAAYFEKLRIDIRTATEAVAIQHPRRRVRTAAGEEIPYAKLIFAAGARPVPGPENSFTLASLDGAVGLRQHLDNTPPGHAWIAGGGYIGLEAAEALRSRGWRVSLSNSGPHLLGRDDPWLTARLRAHLERFRVQVHLEDRALHPRGADLFLWASGLLPNAQLAADAGVELGPSGAIAVDAAMETNLHSLLAAGDCVQAHHRVTGRNVWMPLGTTANKMGRVAGATAAGHRERFHGIAGTSIVRVCGLGVALTGLSESQARAEGFQPVSTVIDARDRAAYFRGRPVSVQLVADKPSGRLLGGAVLGEYGVEGRINVIATALTARLSLDEFASLDLAYAPPFAPVWDPVLIAARQLLKLLH